MNGQQIIETHKPRMDAVSDTTKLSTSVHPTLVSKRRDLSASSQRPGNSQMPSSQNNWYSQQDIKLKITGIPKSYWTKDVYSAMTHFGTVVRVEMDDIRARDNTAWVDFQ